MHFFTEPSKLENQTNSDKFGPFDGDEMNKYRVSSKHKVKTNDDAKIFACQDSMMLVLPNLNNPSGLVNIVLKPIKGLTIPLAPVKYYIYRGVDINSFIDSGAIKADDPLVNTEFINKFWINWNDYTNNLGISPTPPPSPQSFGYDLDMLSSPRNENELLEEYFNSDNSNNNVINDFQAIRVTEGDWIANVMAGCEFEFEIVLDKDKVKFNLEYAQKSSLIIDASSDSFNPQNPTLISLAVRETILNYIDPAAFFGMHHAVGVYLGSWTGNTKNASVIKQNELLITELLDTFVNKNVVYLDIRSERGYSYYYYQNYREDLWSGNLWLGSDVLKLKTTSQQTFNFLDYSGLHWPLINLNNPSSWISPIVQGERIELKLLVKDNEEPLLFAENPKLFGDKNKNNFIDSINIVDPTNPFPNYSQTIVLTTPHYNDGSEDKNFPYHIKLQYFRKKNNSSIDTVFKSLDYLDSAFGGINIPELSVKTPFQHIENTKRTYVTDGADFGYVANSGVLQDNTLVLFYAENAFSFKASTNTYPKFDPSLIPLADIDAVLKLKNVILNKWRINDGVSNIDVLGIVGFNRTTLDVTPKEDLLLLGITQTELSNLNSLVAVSDLHHKYFVLTELFDGSGNRFIDTISSTPYRTFRVDIQGIDPTSREVLTIDSSSLTNNVLVYGMTNYVVCSKDFGAASIVPIQLPDPGTYDEFPSCHKVSYDGNSSMVTDLFPKGRVSLEDNKMTFDSINVPDYQEIDIELVGNLYFPVDSLGGTELSSKKNSFPLIAICHANGAEYDNYDFLAKHLAVNGFIVCSMSGLVDERHSLKAFKLSDLPSSPIPPVSPVSYEEFQYYFELSGFPAIDTTKFYAIVDNRYRNEDPSGFLRMYLYGNDPSDTSSYGQLIVVKYTLTPKHPYNTTFGTDPSVFNFDSWFLTGWSKGVDFNIYIEPESILWERKGGKPGTGLGKFGLKWLKNIGSSSFVARISKADSKLVELTSTEWGFEKHSEIKNAIDNATDLTYVDIPFPSTSIDRYFGTISDEIYYLIKISSSTSTSCSAGTCVEINTEVKNRQLELISRNRIHGARILSRANLVFPHLQICKKFIEESWNITPGVNRIQNNIGLIGHSRGAESVVRCVHEVASGINSFDWVDFVNNGNDNRVDPSWNYLPDGLNNINAVISIAPTDNSDDQNESISENTPYFVLYGSTEGDVIGMPTGVSPNRTSGFSIYDRTQNNSQKGMNFVYGATHRGFIIDNDDFSVTFKSNYGDGGLTPLPVTTQQNIAKSYLNAFMRIHLKNESVWESYIQGSIVPVSNSYDKMYLQFKDMDDPVPPTKWINDFEASSGSTLFDGVSPASVPPLSTSVFQYGELIFLDHRTPHDIKGILINSKAGKKSVLLLEVNPSGKDISSYDFLSFRIGKGLNSSGVFADLSKLVVELKYIGMPISGNFTKEINRIIPNPYIRVHSFGDLLTKTAMMTVRLSLEDFQTNNVDLTKITHIQLTFPSSLTADVVLLMDDFEFTN